MSILSSKSSTSTERLHEKNGSRGLPWLVGKAKPNKAETSQSTRLNGQVQTQESITLASLVSSSNPTAAVTDTATANNPNSKVAVGKVATATTGTTAEAPAQQWQGITADELLRSTTGELTAQFLANLTPDHVMALLFPVLNEKRERRLERIEQVLEKLISDLAEVQRRIDEVHRQSESESGGSNW